MAIEDNKKVIRRYRELHNKNEMGEIGEVLAESFIAHEMAPGVPQTLAGAREIQAGFLAMFPDVQVLTNQLIAEDDKVTEHWTMKGHHTGEPFFIGNVPPSGNPVEVDGITTYRIQDGKIVETWSDMDFMGILRQVGAIPAQS